MRPPESVDPFIKEALLGIMSREFRGIQRAAPRVEIHRILNRNWRFKDNPVSDSTMRRAAEALIEEGHPVCSHQAHGWWFGLTYDELMLAAADRRNKADDLRHKAAALEQVGERLYGCQPGLPGLNGLGRMAVR